MGNDKVAGGTVYVYGILHTLSNAVTFCNERCLSVAERALARVYRLPSVDCYRCVNKLLNSGIDKLPFGGITVVTRYIGRAVVIVI